MKQTAKLALGAIVAALAVAILFAFSVLPFLEYALPALAGALTMLIVVEVDKKWALGVYIAVTLISLLTVPNKEAAVMYAALFGYYPILKAVFESKLNRALEYICKTALFVSTVLAAYYVMIHFMGMSFDDLGDFGKYSVPILIVLGTVVFLVYDYSLTLILQTYMRLWHKKFRKLFKL